MAFFNILDNVEVTWMNNYEFNSIFNCRSFTSEDIKNKTRTVEVSGVATIKYVTDVIMVRSDRGVIKDINSCKHMINDVFLFTSAINYSFFLYALSLEKLDYTQTIRMLLLQSLIHLIYHPCQ